MKEYVQATTSTKLIYNYIGSDDNYPYINDPYPPDQYNNWRLISTVFNEKMNIITYFWERKFTV